MTWTSKNDLVKVAEKDQREGRVKRRDTCRFLALFQFSLRLIPASEFTILQTRFNGMGGVQNTALPLSKCKLSILESANLNFFEHPFGQDWSLSKERSQILHISSSFKNQTIKHKILTFYLHHHNHFHIKSTPINLLQFGPSGPKFGLPTPNSFLWIFSLQTRITSQKRCMARLRWLSN